MERLRKALRRVFHPPAPLLPFLAAAMIAALILTLSYHWGPPWLSYAAYLFSAYALVAIVVSLPELVRGIGPWFAGLPIVKWIDRTPLGHRFFSDLSFRGVVSIYAGLAINLFYAVFKLISGICYSSWWTGAIAVYYIVLCAMRALLVHSIQNAGKMAPEQRELYELRVYRRCGWAMLALDIGMMGMMIQMVRDDRHYEYPGAIIYISALYAFYALTLAVINVIRFRQVKSPMLPASKAITLAAALMSIMALQTAMIAQFGGEDASFRQVANTLTGAGVCLFTFAMALVMVWNGSHLIKKRKKFLN